MAAYAIESIHVGYTSKILKNDRETLSVSVHTKRTTSVVNAYMDIHVRGTINLGGTTYSARADVEGVSGSPFGIATLKFQFDERVLAGMKNGVRYLKSISVRLYATSIKTGVQEQQDISSSETIWFSIGDTFTITNEDGTENVVDLHPVINTEDLFSYVAVDDILPGKPADMLVKGYSKASITFDTGKVETKFDATVAKIDLKFKYGSAVYSTEDFTQSLLTDVLSSGASNDNMPVIITVTDSRGFSTEAEGRIYAYGYSRPVLTGMSAYRSDKDKNENDEGTYLTVQASEHHTALEGHNNCTITVEWGAGGQTGVPVGLTSGTATTIGGGAIQPTSSYVVRFTARDDVGNTNVVSLVVPTPSVTFDALNGGNGFAFGKMAERDGVLESVWDISSHSSIQAGVEQREEDGKFIPKAYMDKDGNIHADGNIDAGGTLACGNAVAENAVSAASGEFSGSVLSPIGEFETLNVSVSLEGTDAAGKFNNLQVIDTLNIGGELSANGGIAGVTNYESAGVEELTGGKWIDGKPIYRYVLRTTTTLTGANGKIGDIPADVDTVVNMHGTWIHSDNNWFPLPHLYYKNLNNNIGYYVSRADNGIYLQVGSAYSGTKTVIVIVEYTKSTE